MAGSVNKVVLAGTLGKPPEVRTTQDGQKIVTLTLATSDTWTDRQSGERKERTEWHRVVIFNDRIGAARYAAASAPPSGGPAWDTMKGGDIDDEIPF
jgi:single stranded DNA-binding protein